MADTSKNVNNSNFEADGEARLKAAFAEAVGGGVFMVRVQRRDPKTNRMLKCPSHHVDTENVDEFIEELSDEYPEGGEFKLTVANSAGHVITNALIYLDRNRRAKKDAPARENYQRQDDSSRSDSLFMMLLEQQRQSADNMMKMMLAMITAQNGRPAPTESPVEILSALVGLQKDLAPPRLDDQNSVEKMLDLMKRIKEALPEVAPAEGLGGVLQSLTPLLAAALQAQGQTPTAQTSAPQVNPTATKSYVLPPPPSAQTPTQTTTGDGDDMMKFLPVIEGIKRIINNSEPGLAAEHMASDIFDYIDIKLRAGELDPHEIAGLLVQFQMMAPEQAQNMFMVVGITDPNHVQIIFSALSQLTESLADFLPPQGPAGNQPGIAPHG